MKKTIFLKVFLLAFMFFQSFLSVAQNLKPFTIRFDRDIKGDQLLIGNSILSKDNNNFNDDDVYNSNVDMKYVDIDGVSSTFSSSSAVLTVPNSNAPGSPCYKIVYAGLYWSGIIKDGDVSVDRTKLPTIQFKTPAGVYNTINGELIYDAINRPGGVGDDKSRPYACYANVTSLLQPLTNANGTYTVADVVSSVGYNGGTGLSAGWSLYIVYEDPNLPARSITSYDGFSGIGGTTTLDINVSGFRTIPTGPVNASFAFAALEGDKKIDGDYLKINGVTQSVATATKPVTSLRDDDNFFNSSVTYIDPSTKKTANFAAPNRIPASSNTLGYDAGIFIIKNDNNSAIGNAATTAKITLGTDGDFFIYYFNAIAVEIIEPKIILTKAVTDGAGNPANNTSVGLGAILKYELQFQNVGNDNAKEFTITDVLPANTTFRYVSATDNDIEQVPAGVTHTYNATTRTITFTIPDNLVLKNGNKSVPIRFKVVVVPTCSNLTEPCNNIIKNTARSKYTGEINTNGGVGFGEASFPSYSGCTVSAPDSTNFLVGLDDCKKRNDVLCGDNVTISATGGYASYSWSTSSTGIPVIGTSQTLTVTKPGTYYVKNTANPPCTDLQEIITVADYPAKPVNPLITYADNKNPATGLIDQCVNDGSLLTKIFLCGEKDFKTINLSSLGATKIIWETTTCARQTGLSDLCPNVSPTCTWTSAAPDGNTFTANTSGQYRVSIYFGGCFSRFYFDVYKNDLKPTVDKKDMICGKDGSITIKGVGAGYEYSLSEKTGYQSSNTFSISTAGAYTVYIKQVGVTTNPCIFKVTDITIYKIDFDPIAPFITQPLCHDGKGIIKVYGTAYNNAQYTYELFKDGVSIEKVINSTASENEFKNKDAGDYTYTVTTLDGCSYNGVAKIIAPAPLTAVYAITKSLTCVNGEITVTAQGGKSPYKYSVNGGVFGTSNLIPVVSPGGSYSIRVLDENNCSFTIPSFTVNPIPKPVYTVQGTNIICYGTNTGLIKFNVANPTTTGYTLAYSIDNGAKYVAGDTFPNLPPGTYKPILKYTLSGVECFDTQPDIIISEPAAAVTASMGVSELAGCGPLREGKVRITNPQGGVAPYEYNFNNPANPSDWTTVNDALKAPGTYTLYVRDFNKCIFSAPVTVDPEPVAPVISVDTPVDFNCDGTATSTVIVSNPGGGSYTYDYYLDGIKNTNVPSNVFLKVAPGTHAIKIEYKIGTVPTFSNLLKEDFGIGEDVTSPGMNSAYCFERQVAATQCRSSIQINDGDYSVTARIVSPFGPWVAARDHTSNATVEKGRFLAVNIGGFAGADGVLYSKPIKDIIQNQPVSVSVYAMNLLELTNGQEDPELLFQLVNGAGVVIASQSTNKIPKTFKKTNPDWINYSLTLNPLNNTNLNFVIRSKNIATSGNDIVIDDINVFQLPKSCITTKDLTIFVPSGKAFTGSVTGSKNVTCAGLDNGEITISATNFDAVTGYQYSLDNGTNWSTALTASPHKISGLAPNTYTVSIRPVGSTVTSCTKTLLPVTITQPDVLRIDPTVVSPVTCLATGTATINAIGGTGTYTYTVTPKLPVGAAIVQVNNNKFIGLGAGVYTVSVKDINDCTIIGADFTINDKVLPTASIDITSSYCAGGAGATLQVTPDTQANYTYSINGGAVRSDGTFSGLTPGKYTIRVTDTSTGCFIDLAEQTIVSPISASTKFLKDLDCDATNPNATIEVTISNGYPNYSYKVSTTAGSFIGAASNVTGSSFTYSAAAGTYYFEITDSKGCTTVVSRTINALVKPDFSTTQVNVKCKTEATGSITVTGIPASGSYTYSKDNGATFQTSNLFTGLIAGDYLIVIKDGKKCLSDAKTVSITEPIAGLTATASATPLTCSTTNTQQAATVTASGSGGTPFTTGSTYLYSFNGGAYGPSNTYTVNTAGPVTINVKDANGCIEAATTVTIAPFTPPTALTFAQANPITCKTTELTTDITVTVTSGVGPFTYEIIAPASAVGSATGIPTNTHTFSALLPNTYTFKVTDANGCSINSTYKVDAVKPITLTGSLVNNVSCNGQSDGSIKYVVAGNMGAFTYSLLKDGLAFAAPANTGTGNTLIFAGLAAATYQITVTNPATGCTDNATVLVTQPAAITALTATATKVFCTQAITTITVSASGGATPLYYAVVPATATAPTFPTDYNTSGIFTRNTTTDGLAYTAYVVDKNGNCRENIPVSVVQDAAPTVSALVSNQCAASGSAFQIVATATGGFAPYTYSINTGVAPSPADTFTVAPGTYTITATDANGCPATTSITVNERLRAVAAVTKDITCSVPQEATIRVNIYGGIAPFTYRVNINGIGYSGGPTAFVGTSFIYIPTSLTGTSYEFEVTDANGIPCTVTSNTVTTTTPVTVTATTSITNLTCFNAGNGAVTINPTAGIAPFEYSFNGSAFSSVSSYSNLAASTGLGYPYVVRDGKGCLFNGFADVKEPNQIIFTVSKVDMTCSAAIVLGSVTVNPITNGFGPYTYLLRNLTTGQMITYTEPTGAIYTFANLSFGNYEIIVTDSQGCSNTRTAQVLAPPDDLVIDLSTTADCTNGATIIVSINPLIVPTTPNYVFGIYNLPTAPFSTSLLPPDGAASPANMRKTFTNLTPGVVYTFVVRDNITGCYYFETAVGPVPPATPLTSSPIVANNVACTGTATGSVTFTLNNYTATAVNWEIFRNQTNASTGITGSVVTPAPSTITTPPGLTPGQYYITFTEVGGSNPGCTSASAVFTITESPVLLDLNVTPTKNDNCSTNAGEIIAIANGGSTPYTFILNTSSIAPAANDPLWNTPSTFNVESGNYYVWVKDNSGCIIGEPVSVILDPSPVIDLEIVDKCVLQGAFEIRVNEVTAGTGAYSISVDGSAFTSIIGGLSHIISGLNSGSHTIIIRDANGCTDTETILIDEPLVATPVTIVLPTCDDNDGVITMSGAGGTGTYTYTINPPAGTITGNVISGLPANTYTITMTDTATPTACTTSAVVTLGAPTPVTFSTATTPALCVGDSNGTITVTLGVGNNNPNYTYEITAPIVRAAQSSNIFTGLPAGTYTVRVNSGRGCSTDDTTVTVGQPTAALAGAAVVTAPLSCGPGNVAQAATVTLNGTPGTGTGAFEYSFNGSAYSTTNVFTVNDTGSTQSIPYGVKDANNCEVLGTVTIDALNPPVFNATSAFTQSVITCIAPTSTVTVTSTNGVGTLTYSTIVPSPLPLQSNNTGIFNNLAPGEYTFLVTDSNGCTDQVSYRVNDVTKISVVEQSTTGITCSTATDGKASFLVTGYGTGIGTYQYALDTNTPVTGLNSATINLINLAAGPHSITVLDDATGCSDILNFTIAAPAAALAISTTVTPLGCTTFGAVTITATDGWGNYDYTLTQPDATFLNNNTGVFGGLMQVGTYNISVVDANGCTITDTFELLPTVNPTATIDVTSDYCYNGGASTALVVTAASASTFTVTPYEYSIDNGVTFQSSNTFSGLTPGAYTVVVKDAFGCLSTAFTETIEPQLFANAVSAKEIFCIAPINGTIKITATGGYGPYSYKVSTDNGFTFPGVAIPFVNTTDTDFSVPAAANYVFEVTDSKGCVFVTTPPVVMADPTPVDLLITDIDVTPVDCTAPQGTNNNGTITVNLRRLVNDNPDYTFALSGTTIRPAQASNIFIGLTPGIYTVTVTSGRGCFASQDVTIFQPAPIVVTATRVEQFDCTSGNTGNLATITVDPVLVTGGSNTYVSYEFIKNGNPIPVQKSDNPTYTEADLLGGSYIVNVYDSKGCVGTTTSAITINPYIQLDKVNVVVNQAITCTDLENITVSATTIGGPATNLQYTLVDVTYDNTTTPPTAIKGIVYPAVPNGTGIFTNLPVGNYEITVKNLDTNCEVIGVHYVNEPNTFDLTIDTIVDVTCFSGMNGSANVTFVDRLITTTPVNGDEAGAFTYTLQDALGNVLPGGFSTNAGPITIAGLAAGTYSITATLSQSPSCTVSKNFTITGPTAALDITETHTEITCVTGNNDGSISVTATGGWVGGYQFELVGPTAAQSVAYGTQTVFTGLTAGTYTVNVRDSKGCVDFVTVNLVNPTPIVATATSSTAIVSCFGDTSATITAGIPTGGSGNYLYSLVTTFSDGTVTTDGPQVSNRFINLGAGTYQVKVSDTWTCSALSATIFIRDPAKVTASLSLATAISCDVDATITLTASGGTAPYEYSTTSTFGTAIPMTGNRITISVPVGTYNYFIRDNNGCVSFVSNDITITKVPDLVIDVNIQNAVINCKGQDSGVIVATAQGGLGNYVYTLLDGAGNPLGFVPTQITAGNFTNLPAGTYLVRVISNDCEAQTTIPVNIIEPLLPLTQSNTVTNITCAGEADGRITIAASGGTGVIKYAISPFLNQFFESNVFDNLKPGFYDYIVQDENGCFEYVTGVEIREPGSVFANVVPNSAVPEICAGDADGAFSLNITGGNAPYTVSLNDRNGPYTTGTLTQTQFDFSGLSGNEQIVYILDANGCESDISILLGEPVTLNPKAAVNYDCENNSQVNSVTITVAAGNAPADLDYSLDGSSVFQNSNVFNNLSAGTHTVDVRHTNGCIKQVIFDVDQVNPITISLADGGLNEIVSTVSGGFGNYQYTLNGEPQGSQGNFIYYKSGDYTVTVTDANGCSATATRYFEFIDIKIPNVFTPNGDGNNDTWAPTNTINYKDLIFEVFDRYGRKIGTYREGQSWNGKYNGNELPSGDYWYILRLRNVQDAREFVGHFTLFR